MGNKVLQAVVDVAGSIDPSLGKAIDEATNKIGGLNLKAIGVGAAVGGIAVATGKAVVEAGKYLKDLGGSFDNVTDTIRVGTGATGDALDSLVEDFDAVYSSIPAEMDDVAKSISDFNTRLDLTGPALQTVSQQALQVSDMLDEDLNAVIEESSQAIKQWNIDSDDMSGAMDYIFKVSQSTGMGFSDLMSRMQQYGPQLQDMGYSFETAATMMGQMEKAGVNTDEVLGALKKSVTTLAKDGIGAAEGLQMYVDQIQNAGSAAEATAIASEVFGARAGSTMAAAIRDGSFAVEDLTASLMANDETIAGAAEDTYDFAERLQVMRQQLEVALKPIANTIFDRLNDFMPAFQRILENVIPVLMDVIDAALPFVDDFLAGAVDLLEMLMPMLSEFAAAILPVLFQLVSTLLPPLLDLASALLPPLMQIVSAILPPIASILATILPLVVQIANMVLPVILQLITSLLPVITPLLNILMQLLQSVIMPLLPPIMQLVQALLPPIMAILQALTPAISAVLGVLGPLASLLATIVGWVAKIVEWVASGLTWVVDLVFGDAGSAPGFATGGFTDGVSIAGEDPRYPQEAVISFNPAYRAQNLSYWAKAGQMLGAYSQGTTLTAVSSGATVVYELGGISFSPQIHVNGDVDEDELLQKLKALGPEFADFILEVLKQYEEGEYDDENDEF